MGRSITASKNKLNSHDGYDEHVSRLGGDARIVMLHGEVSENSIAQVIGHMLHLANISPMPINLIISTYGGNVDEMFSLYDTIKFIPCPVHTIALGKVMSAGVLLLASGEKGKRLIGRSARVMVHPMHGGVSGNVFQVVQETSEMVRMQSLMVKGLMRETKMTRKVIDDIMKKGYDYYVTPDEAVKLGIVDRIVGDDHDVNLDRQKK